MGGFCLNNVLITATIYSYIQCSVNGTYDKLFQ